jgi:uncharacterized damage-inducible protein DinB
MSLKPHFELMAEYNRWMNRNLYRIAAELPANVLQESRGAYFGSIVGTLNHIMVGDIIWLRRFSTHPLGLESLDPVASLPAITSLSQVLHHDIAALGEVRQSLDDLIVAFAAEAGDAHYETALSYRNSSGVPFTRRFGFLVQHFYNHQTHHRGQVTTLLSQIGLDPGVTDLLALIPDAES